MMNMFNKKYDINPEENNPTRIYGIPNYMKDANEDKPKDDKDENKEKDYILNPKDNVPQMLYGVPEFIMNKDSNNKKEDM